MYTGAEFVVTSVIFNSTLLAWCVWYTAKSNPVSEVSVTPVRIFITTSCVS